MLIISENKKQLIEIRLQQVLDSCTQRCAYLSDLVPSFFPQLQKYVFGGKLMRAQLLHFYSQPVSQHPSFYLDLSCALEILHSSLLILDDIMDNDEQRRHLPAMHCYWQNHEAVGKDPETNPLFGTSMALCMANIAQFLVFQIVTESDADPLIKMQAIQIICQELIATGLGQMADLILEQTPLNLTLEKILEVYYYKTSCYSFILPLKLANVFNQYPQQSYQKLITINHHLGIIFQIYDDFIEIVNNPIQLGKPKFSDLKKQKLTVWWYQLKSHAHAEELTTLKNAYEDPLVYQDHLLFLLNKYSLISKLHQTIENDKDKILQLLESDLFLQQHFSKVLMQLMQELNLPLHDH